MSEDLDRDRPTQSPATSTRIDAAHPVHDNSLGQDASTLDGIAQASSEIVEAIAGKDEKQLAAQMCRQANELATHLRSQQRSLDHRESEFHARVAQLDHEMRIARMLIREREQDITDREVKLSWVQAAVGRRPDVALLSETTPAICPERPGNGHVGDPSLAAVDWHAREQLLDQSETFLKQQLADLQEQRRRLNEDRESHQQRVRLDQAQLENVKRSNEEEAERKRSALEQQQLRMESRHAAVEQLHAEMVRMHRESLEMRLCTEQLWAELSATASQPELIQRLGQLRRGLADHFRLANQSLARQRQELQELLDRLCEQQQKIQGQRTELQEWFTQRQDELDSEAVSLAARQQQLDEQASEIGHLQQQWDAQRIEYQAEIRRLMSDLRKSAEIPSTSPHDMVGPPAGPVG